jgi:hypothetical protein
MTDLRWAVAADFLNLKGVVMVVVEYEFGIFGGRRAATCGRKNRRCRTRSPASRNPLADM